MPLLERHYAGQGLQSIGARRVTPEFNEEEAGVETRQVPWESFDPDPEKSEPLEIPIH